MTPDTVETIRIAIVIGGGALLVIAALVGLVRLSRGPTTLDRAVATDLLLGIVLAALAAEAVVNRHTTTLPVMLVLALLSFAGPVAIARFITDPPKPGDARPASSSSGDDSGGADGDGSDGPVDGGTAQQRERGEP